VRSLVIAPQPLFNWRGYNKNQSMEREMHMWRDSFRIGVAVIDEQHKELFAKTEELLRAIQESKAGRLVHKEKCISTVLFLKDYAVRHFADEEAYQKQIGCKDFEAHKAMHVKFVQAVLSHEKSMVESDFGEKEVRSFAGMLAAWLLYHVADADQKIGKETKKAETLYCHNEIVLNSFCHVLSKIAGIDSNDVKEAQTQKMQTEDSVTVGVGLIGGATGFINFIYSAEFVKNLIYSMMSFRPESIGDLEISALFEASNIISANICGKISKAENIVCDITAPFIAKGSSNAPHKEIIAIDTGIGIIETEIIINY
jgi:hemerythrin-like metal-binding protein